MPYIVDNDSSAVEDPFHNHELRQSLRNLAYHTAVNMSHSRNRILILINELYFHYVFSEFMCMRDRI